MVVFREEMYKYFMILLIFGVSTDGARDPDVTTMIRRGYDMLPFPT